MYVKVGQKKASKRYPCLRSMKFVTVALPKNIIK